MIVIPKKEIWTRQPTWPSRLDSYNKQTYGIVDAFTANNIGGSLQPYTAGGDPVLAYGYDFVGFNSGYFSTPFIQVGSSGVGGILSSCRVNHFVFRVTSNSASQGIASIGSSPDDGGAPQFILQNNAGTLRVLYLAAYRNLGAAVVGKVHCVSISYSDFSPYTHRLYLDGELVETINSYVSFSAQTTYLGSGFPTESTNADLILYVAKSSTLDSQDDVKAFANNPWQIYEPRRRHVFVGESGGGADVTLDPTTGSLTVTGQTPTITLPVSLTATTGSIVVAGNQPTVTNPVALSPTTGAVTIAGNTPSITIPVSLTAITGSITFTGNQPTIEAGGGVTLDPTTGSVLFSGNAPTITLPVSLTATTGSITFTGNQPTIDAPGAVTLTPTTGAISLSGNTATITLPVSLTPGAGSIVFTGNQPTVNTGADVIITPTVGSIFFSGQTPSFILPVALTPTTGAISFFGNVPSITIPVSLAPSAGQLVTIGNAPTITIGATATAILDLRYSARAVRRDYTAIYGQGSRNE